jgi:zinc transport system substrate-binding protein
MESGRPDKRKVMTSKKFIKLILSSVLFVIFITPAQAEKGVPAPHKLRVVTSFYPMYIMALNVCQDVPEVELANLTPLATGCLHDYALTTADMQKLERADVFIGNGAGMESFLRQLTAKYPHLKVVELAAGMPLIKNATDPNPHVWLSVANAIVEVRNLATFMAGVDAVHAARYRQNGQAYIARLEVLRREMQTKLAVYRGVPLLTFHEAFAYFAQEFGLKLAGVIDREPGSSPNAKELAETIATIKKLRVKALFTEPQYPIAAAETIARETGIPLLSLDPAVTGPARADAYLVIMRRNLASLQAAFK